MAVNYNPFQGDYSRYGRGMTAGMHTFFNPAPMASISTIDPSLDTPYTPPSQGGALANLPPYIIPPHDGDSQVEAPGGSGVPDLTSPSYTPDTAKQAVSNYATAVDLMALGASAIGNTVMPGLGSVAAGAISQGGSKDLETLRGTLAHLGYVDPEKTSVSKQQYYSNYPELFTIPEHIGKQYDKHIAPIVEPVVTPVTTAIKNVINNPLDQFFGPGDKSKTPGIQFGRAPVMAPEVINPYTSLPPSTFKAGGYRGRPIGPPISLRPSPKPVPVTRAPVTKPTNPWGIVRKRTSTDPAPPPTYDPSLETDPGTSGDDYADPGYGKIICTMMNRMYGLGEYRIKQWLLYSKRHLTEEHQLGYHKLYCRLVSKMPSNKLIAKVLSHLADRRTNDIVAEMKGTKRDQLGRLYRAILIDKPSYLVGSMIKRNWLKPADISVLQKG